MSEQTDKVQLNSAKLRLPRRLSLRAHYIMAEQLYSFQASSTINFNCILQISPQLSCSNFREFSGKGHVTLP